MQMCQAFADAGHDVTLFARRGEFRDDIFRYYGVNPSFELVTSQARGTRRLREWTYAAATYSKMRRRGVYDFIYGRHLPSLAVAARGETPFVFECHQPASPMNRAIERVLFRRRNLYRVVYISEALSRNYQRRRHSPGVQQTMVAHDAACVPHLQMPDCSATDSGRKLQVGYTGSLYAGRGIELIVKLANRNSHLDFQVCGGPEDVAVQWQRRTADLSNIQFHSQHAPSEMPTWQQSMDILVAPFQRESPIADWMSPLKIFEYMASGRPIVTSDFPVLREVLEPDRTALLVRPDDVDAWSDALNELQSPFRRNTLAVQAFDEVRRNYSWQGRAENVLSGLVQAATHRAA